MTGAYDSEKQLFFSDSEEDTRSHRKRNSLGFRLPVSTHCSHSKMSRDNKSASGSGAGVGGVPLPSSSQTSGPGQGFASAGTTLGFGGATQVSAFVFSKGGTEFNIFSGINKGVNSVHLEKIIVILIANPTLTKFGNFIDDILYQGFDREFYIKHALTLVSVETFCQFAIMGAIRGSNFKKIRETSISVPPTLISLVDGNVVIKKAKKRTDLTILRFTACIPHWVSYWLWKHNVPAKLEKEGCPTFLQFPGAASVPMSKNLRLEHISFCREFSKLLPGGMFDPNIYLTAYNNMVPIADMPADFRTLLGVSSESEAKVLTDQEKADMSKQLVRI